MRQLKNNILLKKIAIRIKELRQKNNITQEDFYNDTDIHIGRIEQGHLNITVSTLDQICKYFGITLQEFFENFN
jgi:transcriptional regulator with XRE-family HTH domain